MSIDLNLIEESSLTKCSCNKLKKRLYSHFKILKQTYKSTYQKQNKTSSQEWLTDNFYILEKEAKSIFKSKDDKILLSKTPESSLPLIYKITYDSFISSGLKDFSEKNIISMINEIYKRIYLSVEELAFLPTIIKIALIDSVYFSVVVKQDENSCTSTIAFAIKNIKNLESLDFNKIIEETSPIEKILSLDPTKTYTKMDDESKSYYRYLLSEIAKKEKISEKDLALKILNESKKDNKHIGYYLKNNKTILTDRKKAANIFILTNIFLPLILSLGILLLTKSILISIILYFPFWEIVKPISEFFIIKKCRTDFLPRLDIDNTIPDEGKTLIVVSTILPKASQAKSLKTRLENLYFSNGSGNVNFCILADFTQNSYPSAPSDKSQIDAAARIIDFLNNKYGNRFFLITRKRTYSKTQNAYIGWERKRGAITQLIRFIKGKNVPSITCQGDKNNLKDTKYIIALDADTELLIDSAQKFVATALHPLNKPILDKVNKKVIAGHGILTPRIGIDLSSAKSTVFSRIMAGCGGTTMYDMATKDLYQNLFGESIFSGKGLIDVDAYYEILDDKFPSESVLSHDILEGIYLKSGFVSDIELTDGYPSSIDSDLSRSHRWIRGDWQNISYLSDKNISKINKYKLFDNLRRSISPLMSLVTILIGIFLKRNFVSAGNLICFIGFLSVTFNSLFAAFMSILSSGWFTISRKFYTQVIPQAFQYIFQSIFLIITLISQTINSTDAIIRALYRKYISKKNLLEWVTAAQADSKKISALSIIKRFLIPELVGLFILLICPSGGLKLLGLLFSLIIPLVVIGGSKNKIQSIKLTSENKETLTGYAADMWKFYEDHFNLSCNYLPPDNIQLAPIRAVAYRTSPTNIGFLLISTLAARDFDFIDTNTLYTNINHTLTTIENLEKWHGNLYNWYDIKTLKTIDPFVSTVDSGNFVACLIALKEGLKDYYFEKKELSDLVRRLQKIIDETDLSKFYCKKRNLFSIGFNTSTNKLFDSYYDFLMSEARLTSYFAVAKRHAPKKHWGCLNRTLSRNGLYAGPISWTGTMFEFFMPHLLLPSFSGSLLDEALRYCVYCQQKLVSHLNIPWGISESAFYAFDNNLYYQYKAHGVQKLGVKQNLDKDLVISPYSTFLTLPFFPKMAMKNLFKMEKMGVRGTYGFFEAVDFTKSRVDDMEIIKSYMAHHIGMSMIAATNAIFDNRMQKRFMRDKNMKATKELLEEKIARDAVVYDNVTAPLPQKNIKISRSYQEYDVISPAKPQIAILKNTDITSVLTDNGCSYLMYGNKCLTRKPFDLIRKPQGIFLFLHCDDLSFSATPAPFYNKDINYQTKFSSHCVSYLCKNSFLQTTMLCYLDKTIACEQRQIIVKNNSNNKKSIDAMILLEPILTEESDYIAHPAFNKLFITSKYDKEYNILIFTKRLRENQSPIYLAVGFLENIPFDCLTQKETLISSSHFEDSVLSFYKKKFKPSNGLPDAIAAIKLNFDLQASAQHDFSLIITSGESLSEIIDNIIKARNKGHLDTKSAAKSKLFGDTIEDKISSQLLPSLIFERNKTQEIISAMKENKLNIDGLWSMSISGDLPIVLLQVTGLHDSQRIEIYIRTLKKLRICGVLFDLVLTYRDLKGEIILKNFLQNIVQKLDASLLINVKGGIFLINLSEISPEQITILKAMSAHIVRDNLATDKTETEKFSLVKILSAAPKKEDLSQGLKINGGTFIDDKFYVEKTSSLPYTHVLSNQTFGTLLSDKQLGFTWATNSRENKLTPWFNDISSDNDGELLIIKIGEKYYNMLSGAQAIFSPQKAVYQGLIEDIEYWIEVFIPEKGNKKFCSVKIKNNSNKTSDIKIAYYIEPILGVNPQDNSKVFSEFQKNTIISKNCLNGKMIALSSEKDSGNIIGLTDKLSFFSGNWEEKPNSSFGNCAALVSEISLEQKSEKTVLFSLSFIKSKKQLQNNITLFPKPSNPIKNKIEINTPDCALNYMINTWVPHQIICGRIWARTGFYQCGGAFGFRDQLQDSLCFITLDPKITKNQIIRASCMQFEEGDVLHWWHNMSISDDKIHGVRTKYSDDLLWLPYVTAEYVAKTNDTTILDIKTNYLTGDILKKSEYEKYFSPAKSDLKESIYSHCIRAINRSLKTGPNGLPLIGCGDWSDGYNRVGILGKGESVWLGMFLAMILEKFSNICKLKNDIANAEKYLSIAKKLKENIDQTCWDGDFYLRAFYDDGSKMGSLSSDECKIDSLPQSFSVFSKMPNKERINKCLESCIKYLVDEENNLINLFSPPFVDSMKNPGYVKSYPAGIRENGGQYTHASVWLAMALIENENTEKGYELLKMLCPANRCLDETLAKKYMVEPYYLSGDVYSNPDIKGHGGWSIYTGSAGWFYKAVTESLLGITLNNGHLEINPKLPSSWKSFGAKLNINGTDINLSVSKNNKQNKTNLPIIINLDGSNHNIKIDI